MGLIRFIGKISVLPIILILALVHLLFVLGLHVGSYVFAVFLNIMIICAIIAIINAQWMSLGILVGMILAGLIVLFGAATVQIIVDGTRDSLLDFVRS